MKIEWNQKEIIAKIAAVSGDVAEKGAEMVARDARRLVPVETGKLKESIKVSKSRFKDGGHVVSMGGGDLYYGSFVELGASGKPAKPFMRPALAKNKPRIRKMFRDAMK